MHKSFFLGLHRHWSEMSSTSPLKWKKSRIRKRRWSKLMLFSEIDVFSIQVTQRRNLLTFFAIDRKPRGRGPKNSPLLKLKSTLAMFGGGRCPAFFNRKKLFPITRPRRRAPQSTKPRFCASFRVVWFRLLFFYSILKWQKQARI